MDSKRNNGVEGLSIKQRQILRNAAGEEWDNFSVLWYSVFLKSIGEEHNARNASLKGQERPYAYPTPYKIIR